MLCGRSLRAIAAPDPLIHDRKSHHRSCCDNARNRAFFGLRSKLAPLFAWPIKRLSMQRQCQAFLDTAKTVSLSTLRSTVARALYLALRFRSGLLPSSFLT